MTQPLSGRAAAGAMRVVEALHLRWAARRAVHALPPAMRRRVSHLQVRAGYMEGLTLVPEEDLERACGAALRLLGEDAEDPAAAYLEFGVYVGTSMACMYRATMQAGADRLRLIGFDSFQGMPAGVEKQDDQRWREGDLSSDVELTRTNLTRLGVALDRIELVPGWYEESLTAETRDRLAVQRAVVVMIDCVIASSTSLALEFCAPLIRDRAVIFFDDWQVLDLADRGMGERVAFEAWLAGHPELVAEELPDLAYRYDARAFMVTRAEGSAPVGAPAEG